MDRYEQSKTFQLLGNQYYNQILTQDNIAEIKEILNSYNSPFLTDPTMAGADIFVLGYINGKRAERAKRKSAHTGNRAETEL